MLDGNRDMLQYGNLVSAQQVRWDFIRTGAVIGGAGEGVYAAGTCNMLIDGTPAVTFAFGPPSAAGTEESWVIRYVRLCWLGLTAPLIAQFGNGAALNTGILMQISRDAPPDGGAAETTTLATLFTNADWELCGGEVNRQDDGTDAHTIATWTPRNLVMHGRYQDTIEVVVRDDLSAYTTIMYGKIDAYVISG